MISVRYSTTHCTFQTFSVDHILWVTTLDRFSMKGASKHLLHSPGFRTTPLLSCPALHLSPASIETNTLPRLVLPTASLPAVTPVFHFRCQPQPDRRTPPSPASSVDQNASSTTSRSRKMGGDGGVIASNRRYLRGAGTASDKTVGDRPGHEGEGTVGDPTVLREQRARDLRTCALTQRSFTPPGKQQQQRPIVACPYGRLYDKEAALEALLRKDTRLSHVRGLRDLVDIRFHWSEAAAVNNNGGSGGGSGDAVPTCPISEKAFNGMIPVVAIVPGNADRPNVVSERSLQNAGEWLLDEYQPMDRTLRLIPTSVELDQIRTEWLEHVQKSSKTKAKKRSRNVRSQLDREPSNGQQDSTELTKKKRAKDLQHDDDGAATVTA